MKRKNKLNPLYPLCILILLISIFQKEYTPDTNVNGVELMYSKSFENKFKAYKLPEYYEAADHAPKLEFINIDKTQKFTVFHCYASGKNAICTFRIEFRKIADSIPFYGIKIIDKNFRTGRGIQLGMTIENFKKKIGTKTFKTDVNKSETKITIELDNFKDDPFLQMYNMPLYLGEYYFKNGKLIIFEFGFPNP